RVQLQQLQRRVHVDRRRTARLLGADPRRAHRHPHLDGLQGGVHGADPRLRSRERVHDHHLRDRRGDLHRRVPPYEVAGGAELMTLRKWFLDTGWRHLAGVIVLIVAMLPIVFVISSSLNPSGTLTGSNALFSAIGFDSYARILSNPQAPFPMWFANTLIISGLTAILTVFLGALAAYAFSRMRFAGRRVGLITIVVVQMFPQLLAVVAI